MKLLLVEDEKLLSKTLSKGLRKLGYAVDCAYNGEEALYLYDLNQYDLMILDLNLPVLDGIEVLKTIRKSDQELNILILSARNAVKDKIGGLDTGCNDYMTKPFDFGELEARIRSLLRRTFIQRDVRLSIGGLMVDTSLKCAYFGEMPLSLTNKEYALLEYLLLNRDRVLPAEELIEHVWDSDTDLFSNTFKFHVHSLRKKLSEFPDINCSIVTLKGQGYRIMEGQG